MSENPEISGIFVSECVTIPDWELSEQFIRASGPGGQNINKVSSAVQLRWNVGRSSIPAEVKARFCRIWRSRITGEGDVIVEAQTHRRQALNREEARRRLAEMVAKALHPPKKRIPTKPGKGAVERRITAKKQRGGVKAARKPVARDE